MKKILLGTTALIGAALLAGAASAEDPKVTVGGFSTFEAGWVSSDFDANKQNQSFRNDNEVHFNVAGKTDAGLGYGAEIDLQADIDGADSASGAGANGFSQSGIVARRTYGWLQGDQWGHVEFGSNEGAAATLKVDASNIARASGGINGDWRFFADTNANGTGAAPAAGFAGGRQFITSANLPVENGPATGFFSDAFTNDTKITYYTPRFSGFQLGVSYVPELADRGEADGRYDGGFAVGTSPGATNVWEGGINYENQFDQIGVAVAATGETGNTNGFVFTPGTSNLNNINAWNLGAKLSYMGWSLAGSYGDWSDSENVSSTSAWYATGGLAYETGPFGASVTYLYSQDKFNGTTATSQNNKFQDVSVGVDYKLAPGLTPFIEYTYYDIDPTDGTGANAPSGAGFGENKGNVVILGTQLSF